MPTAPSQIVIDYVIPTAAAPGAVMGQPSITPVAPVAMLANFTGPVAAAPGAPTGTPVIVPVAPVAMLANFTGPTAAAPGAPTGTPVIVPVAPVAMLANFTGPTAAAPGAVMGQPSIVPVAPVAMMANFTGPTAAAPGAVVAASALIPTPDYSAPMRVILDESGYAALRVIDVSCARNTGPFAEPSPQWGATTNLNETVRVEAMYDGETRTGWRVLMIPDNIMDPLRYDFRSAANAAGPELVETWTPVLAEYPITPVVTATMTGVAAAIPAPLPILP